MARYQVVIETHETESAGFRADVVGGPAWARGSTVAHGCTRKHAFDDAAESVRMIFPKHTFEFIHAST
jgi:hypothetical protein